MKEAKNFVMVFINDLCIEFLAMIQGITLGFCEFCWGNNSEQKLRTLTHFNTNQMKCIENRAKRSCM